MGARPPSARVDLGVEARLRLGVLGDEVPGPGERVRRGLVPGEQDGHHLVAEMAVGHARAVAFDVGGDEQHRQQVAAVLAAGPPLRDDPVDDAVEKRHRPVEARVAGQGQLVEHGGEGQREAREEADDDAQRLRDLRRLCLHVGVEQRLGRHPQRQRHHLGVDVQRLTVGQPLAAAQRVRRHRLAVGGDALPVERGLGEAALAGVELAFAGEQPFAQEELGPLDPLALRERVLVGHQHVLDVIGVAQEEHVVAAEAVEADVAVGPRALEKEAQRVAPEVQDVAEEGQPRRARRERGHDRQRV